MCLLFAFAHFPVDWKHPTAWIAGLCWGLSSSTALWSMKCCAALCGSAQNSVCIALSESFLSCLTKPWGYNIFCTMSDQPLSMVPYEFTWLERGGLQCYLRKGDWETGRLCGCSLLVRFDSVCLCISCWCCGTVAKDLLTQRSEDTSLRLVRPCVVFVDPKA